MFVPITTIARVKNLDEAMRLANDVDYGLTAGFYGTPGRSRLVLRQYRSRCHLRQPPAGRHHRRLAGLPALWRLERLRLDRQKLRRALLPAAVHARTNPHPRSPRVIRSALISSSARLLGRRTFTYKAMLSPPHRLLSPAHRRWACPVIFSPRMPAQQTDCNYLFWAASDWHALDSGCGGGSVRGLRKPSRFRLLRNAQTDEENSPTG